MSRYQMSPELREALNYLASENLWAYDLEIISRCTVGLRTIFRSETPTGAFNQNNQVPTRLIEAIIKTCSALRSRLIELRIDQEHKVFAALMDIIDHADWHFSSSYNLSQDIIDEERFYDKVYRLLRELNLCDSSSRLHDSWDFRSIDEKQSAKDKYRNELLEFVKTDPFKVVSAAYRLGTNQSAHTAKLNQEREAIFKLHLLIEHEKKFKSTPSDPALAFKP